MDIRIWSRSIKICIGWCILFLGWGKKEVEKGLRDYDV